MLHWTVSPRQGEPGHPSVPSAESDNRAGPLGPCVERRTAHVGAILPSMCGPGHALSLTAHLSAPQFRNFKIIYRRYAGLYFCICVDVNDNNLAYLEAIHNFVEVHGLGAGGRRALSRSPLLGCGALSLGEGTLSFSAHLDVSSGVCSPSLSLCLVSLFTYLFCLHWALVAVLGILDLHCSMQDP